LVVHVDNCSVDTSNATELFMADHQMLRVPHPPYSPDHEPSDFYSLGIVKHRLERVQELDSEDCFEQPYVILHSFSIDELKRVFVAWIERVRQVSQGAGE
jgi:hypothetical protein